TVSEAAQQSTQDFSHKRKRLRSKDCPYSMTNYLAKPVYSRDDPCGRPICIKLRTAELRIAQLLEGTRRVLPPVGPAIGSHRGTHPSQHHLPGHLASYRQNQPGHRPLDDLPRFEEAPARVSPTALQGHPMLKKQAQELGVQLGQDALGLAASPRVNFAFLLPQLPQQFDLPAQAHERHDLSSREHVALD